VDFDPDRATTKRRRSGASRGRLCALPHTQSALGDRPVSGRPSLRAPSSCERRPLHGRASDSRLSRRLAAVVRYERHASLCCPCPTNHDHLIKGTAGPQAIIDACTRSNSTTRTRPRNYRTRRHPPGVDMATSLRAASERIAGCGQVIARQAPRRSRGDTDHPPLVDVVAASGPLTVLQLDAMPTCASYEARPTATPARWPAYERHPPCSGHP